MRRLFKWSAFLLLSLLLLTIAGGYYLFMTQGGFQRLLGVVQGSAPGSLVWDKAAGKLLDRFNLEGIDYHQPDGLELTIANSEFSWHPESIFSGELVIEKLRLDGVDLHLPDSGEVPSQQGAPKTIALPDIHLPLSIKTNNIAVTNLRIFQAGKKEPVVIDRIGFNATFKDDVLNIEPLVFQMPDVNGQLKGKIVPQGEYPLDLTLNWDYRDHSFGKLTGSGQVEGSLERLEIDHEVQGSLAAKLNGNLENLTKTPSWDLALQLKAEDLSAFSPQLNRVPVNANVSTTGSLDIYTARGELTTSLPQTGPVEIGFSGNGNTEAVAIEQLSLRPVSAPGELNVSGRIGLKPVHLGLKANWQNLGWPLQAEQQVTLPTGKLNLDGPLDALKLAARTTVKPLDATELDLRLEGEVTPKRYKLDSIRLHDNKNGMQFSAKVLFEPEKQNLDVTGQWSKLIWPLKGEAMVQSEKGQFSVNGSLDDYELSVKTDLAGQNIPEGKWSVTGTGSKNALGEIALEGALLSGVLNASGNIGWSPRPEWNLVMSGNNLNPGEKWPDFKGNLLFAIATKGFIQDGAPNVDFEIRKLRGRVANQPVAGRGAIALKNEELKVDNLLLSSGESQLKVNGSLDNQFDLTWTLRIPGLAKLVPEASGRIKAEGHLGGDRKAPLAKLDVDLRELKATGLAIPRLSGNALIDLSAEQRSEIKISGERLQLAGQEWRSLEIAGEGKPDRHRLSLALNGKQGKFKLGLNGGLEGERWRGEIATFRADTGLVGDWVLEKKAGVAASKKEISLGQLCLQSKPTKICADGAWDKSKGSKAEIDISALDPSRFRQFLPEDLNLNFLIDARSSVEINAEGQTKGKASLVTRPGAIRFLGEIEPVEFPLGENQLIAQIDGERIDSSLVLNLQEKGRIEGELQILGLSAAGEIRGRIKGALEDLEIISAFAPQLQDVKGRLITDIALSGTPEKPGVSGQITLRGFTAEVPQAAIRIEKANMSLVSRGGEALKLSGEAYSGEGVMKLSGELEPASKKLLLDINGERFQVSNTSKIKIEVSPSLKVAMDNQGMRVEGKLKIPRAQIKAGGAGDGKVVNESGDVIVIDEAGTQKKASPAANLYVDLEVLLGEDISVEVADFSGKLKGKLRVRQEPGLAPLGSGKIEVVNGDYLVYGQQLAVQRGKILFGGGPVDNPRLELDVARRVEAYDVLAGARIRGTAQAPILQLYSEPPMPDSSILSYMLLGQPPGTKGGSFTLGKYLTPDLYVGYGIGLFDAVNTFNMRYRLTDKLALQAASGIASSADLIYTIER